MLELLAVVLIFVKLWRIRRTVKWLGSPVTCSVTMLALRNSSTSLTSGWNSRCLRLIVIIFQFYRADLDPIYYCELLKTCTIKDDGDAKINSITISPPTVTYGEKATWL